MNKKYSYLIIEDELSVFEAIDERMKSFTHWQAIPHSSNAFDAIDKLQTYKPELIFIDWHLVGSSGYDVLEYLLQQDKYHPYIIFMTGQLENPMQITKTIINKYKNVDVFIDKPIWENLTNHLATYIQDAETKAFKNIGSTAWIQDINGNNLQIDLHKIVCILQHPTERAKNIYLHNNTTPIIVNFQWQDCYELLSKYKVDYFITNKRTHLIIKTFIEKFERPFIRLNGFNFKVEIVKDSIKDFEVWLK